MNDYLKLFQSHAEYEAFVSGGTMVKPNVSHCINENEVHYNQNVDYSKKYLTFESLADNTKLYFRATRPESTKTISVSTDNGRTWNECTSNNDTNGALIATLRMGQKLMIKGNLTTPQSGRGYTRFNGLTEEGECILYGNIMSLVYGDDFIGKTSMTKIVQEPIYGENDEITGYEEVEQAINLGWLFESVRNLVSAENLVLPATELSVDNGYGVYEGMFRNCTSLITAPSVLPATTLAGSCYYRMFYGCTSLVNAPELPATTLAGSCYQEMFSGCTSLTTAPELPATTLAGWCYNGMFSECTNLTTAPELPATTLTDRCYCNLFNGCASLNYIKCLATDISATNCTYHWVGTTDPRQIDMITVAPTGTFVKAPSMEGWTTGFNGIPTNWTLQNAS